MTLHDANFDNSDCLLDFFLTDLRSYESLPPNFSLLQNMAAGAFAGIAVSD